MSHARGIWAQFESLTNTLDSSAVSAIRCGPTKQHLLVKGQYGEPLLLLASELRVNPRAPISLKNVSVSFDVSYETTTLETGSVSTGCFCRFSCDPQNSTLHRYFVEILAATAEAHEGRLTQTVVDDIVEALLELFRKMAAPPRKTVAGLWGELLLIHAGAHPGVFVDAWHSAVTDTFDFSFLDARLEVKATERPIREHEFALKQVRGGRPGDLIVSVRLARSSVGATVLDLTRDIASRVSLIQQEKLWRLVLETLGDGAEGAEEQTFDVVTAIGDLLFLPAIAIPAPTVSVVDESVILDVRFRANISAINAKLRIVSAVFLGRSS